jgi:hypothetical protein
MLPSYSYPFHLSWKNAASQSQAYRQPLKTDSCLEEAEVHYLRCHTEQDRQYMYNVTLRHVHAALL